MVTASIQPGNLVQSQLNFACNLEPEVGDVDLGFPSGVPLPAVRTRGDSHTFPFGLMLGRSP